MGKAYSAAGQAAACLHTMYLLQAYQAELLGDHDEEVVVRTQFAKCIGPQICLSGLWQHLVATERHLWLNLSNIKRKEKNFLMGSQPQPSKCKTVLRTVFISQKAAG